MKDENQSTFPKAKMVAGNIGVPDQDKGGIEDGI